MPLIANKKSDLRKLSLKHQAQKQKQFKTKRPRVAVFDIENGPSLGYFWGKIWETSILRVEAPWYMLCFSYKWLGEKKVYTHALPDYPGYKKNKEDDRALLKDLHKLFDEADILIAHNGDRFDIRKTNARFVINGMLPPKPYKTIDTLKIARRLFHFESNKLGDLGQYFKLGKKLVHTGFDLWARCMRGEDKAWDLMRRYNRRDITLLERVYDRLKPYIVNHPNLGLYTERPDHPECPTCQSAHVVRRGFAVSRKRQYRQYHCMDCGSWFQGDLIKD